VPVVLALVIVGFVLWLSSKGKATATGAGSGSSSPVPVGGSDAVSSALQAASPSDALDNITQAIAQWEGFFKSGSVSQRNNNPGDIETSSGSYVDYQDSGDGWDALYQWVSTHAASNPQWNFYDMMDYYQNGSTTAKPQQNGGDSDAYAEYVAGYLGVDPSSPVSQALGG